MNIHRLIERKTGFDNLSEILAIDGVDVIAKTMIRSLGFFREVLGQVRKDRHRRP